MELSKSQLKKARIYYERSHDVVLLENTGYFLICHLPSACVNNKKCTMHARSEHSMRSFPQQFRWDTDLMERVCEHGVGHPDPDEINLDKDGRASHGCDGCCAP